jgi:ribosome modulation factor
MERSGQSSGGGGWKGIQPAAYQQGWDAAVAGRPREFCDFFGSGPRAAWNEGYDDALKNESASGEHGR